MRAVCVKHDVHVLTSEAYVATDFLLSSFKFMSARRSISVQLSRLAAVTHVIGKAAAVLHLPLLTLMLQGRDENKIDKAVKTG